MDGTCEAIDVPVCERSLSMELDEAGFVADAYPPTLQVDFVEPNPR